MTLSSYVPRLSPPHAQVVPQRAEIIGQELHLHLPVQYLKALRSHHSHLKQEGLQKDRGRRW